MPQTTPTIAIIIPSYNEELTIVQVMQDFYSYCPEANIYVIDNNSSDKTAELTQEAYQSIGCKGHLISEKRQGKALAVKKAFSQIDADIYVMVDADLTYPAKDLHKLLQPVLNGEADMVCGDRHHGGTYSRENKRPMHDIGNKTVRWMINRFFSGNLQDMLTGYRVFSKKFVKNYPILSKGFELETEISIHALDNMFPVVELPIEYKDRPEGSFSKLDTVSDGIKVIKTIFSVLMNYRPLFFYSILGSIFLLLSVLLGLPSLIDYVNHQYVYHIPSAILSMGFLSLAAISMVLAIILHGIRSFQRNQYALTVLHWEETNHTR